MQLFPALPEVVQGTFRPAPFGRLERRGGGPAKGGFILNQTTNYQLSQWEATDRILMSDFNADNAKIDAALATIGHSQLIRTVTTEHSVSNISLQVDNIDWNEWELVMLHFPYRAGVLQESDHFSCSINGGQVAGSNSTAVGNFLRTGPYPYLLIFLPWHDASRQVQAVSFGNVSTFHQAECSFSEVTSLLLGYSSQNYKLPSITLSLWGVK